MRLLSPSQLSAIGGLILAISVLAAGTPAGRVEAASAESIGGSANAMAPVATTAPGASAAAATEAAVPEAGPRTADDAADEALRALTPRVRRSSHADALRTAFTAYYHYRAANPDAVKKPYLYYIDMGLDNRTARGYVFDMDRLEVVEGPFTVAHGRGSARTRDAVPTTFSNRAGSKQTSLGLYLAQETYSFSGKLAGRRYSSVGLRMRGESGEFNSAARRRGIVAHGAPYVTAGNAGRSEGCPAMEMDRAKRLLPLIANGGVVYIYSPNDRRFLERAPWLQAD